MLCSCSPINVPNLVRIGSSIASPGGGEISPNARLACLFFSFYVFFSRDRAQVKPVGRFRRVIRQNACFGPRRCLLGSRKINFSVFTPKIAKNPNFGALSMHFLWKTKNANKFWTVSPIIMKFGMQSLTPTPQKCSMLKRTKIWKSKMAADAVIFCVSRYRALVKPGDRFGRAIRQNACFGTRRGLVGVQNDKYFSFAPLKLWKALLLRHFNACPSWTHWHIKTANINAKT